MVAIFNTYDENTPPLTTMIGYDPEGPTNAHAPSEQPAKVSSAPCTNAAVVAPPAASGQGPTGTPLSALAPCHLPWSWASLTLGCLRKLCGMEGARSKIRSRIRECFPPSPPSPSSLPRPPPALPAPAPRSPLPPPIQCFQKLRRRLPPWYHASVAPVECSKNGLSGSVFVFCLSWAGGQGWVGRRGAEPPCHNLQHVSTRHRQ